MNIKRIKKEKRKIRYYWEEESEFDHFPSSNFVSIDDRYPLMVKQNPNKKEN